MRALLVGLVLLGPFACSGRAAEPSHHASSPEVCGRMTSELASWLAKLEADGPPMVPTASRGARVAIERSAHRVEPAALLEVQRDVVLTSGKLIGTPGAVDEIRAALTEELAGAARFGMDPTAAARILVSIDADAPWSLVSAAVGAAAEAGYRRAAFLFDGRGTAPPPPRSSATAWFEEQTRRGSSGRSTALDPAIHDAPPAPLPMSDRCRRSIDDVLRSRPVEPDGGAALLAGLPVAIADCGCDLEIPALQAQLWAMWDRFSGPPATSVELVLAPPGAEALPLVAPEGATWEVAHRVVLAADPTAPVRLELER